VVASPALTLAAEAAGDRTLVFVALIAAGASIAGSLFVWLSSRRANETTSEADVRKWADSLLVTLQSTQKEMEQVRKEAHALADELREVRREAWREDSMPRFRDWLSRRPSPDAPEPRR
jgi:uncharacterized protein YlxW (UPF0749 family)